VIADRKFILSESLNSVAYSVESELEVIILVFFLFQPTVHYIYYFNNIYIFYLFYQHTNFYIILNFILFIAEYPDVYMAT
jgi:hypothetical protein